nr:LysM domain-containing protein [Tanacetum cinerariifolium]
SPAFPVCSSVIGVKSGDTCFDIANNFELSSKAFESINPNLNCDKLFVVSPAFPVCSSVIGVKSGDTCFDIANNFELSSKAFESINPNLNCDQLFVGEWICVKGL